MEKVITIIIVMCGVAIVICSTQWLTHFIKKERHELRKKIRSRYVIKEPRHFFKWSDRLSLIEIRYFARLLNGKNLIKELEGTLAPR